MQSLGGMPFRSATSATQFGTKHFPIPKQRKSSTALGEEYGAALGEGRYADDREISKTLTRQESDKNKATKKAHEDGFVHRHILSRPNA